jgi:aspartokinase
MTMERIRLGGIKISEERSHLTASCRSSESALPEICSGFAAHRINLGHLTHMADTNQGTAVTSLTTEAREGYSSYFVLKASSRSGTEVQVQTGINLLSIFPHDQCPGVTGALLELLAQVQARPLGLASSPSAMSFLLADEDTARVIDGLFAAFNFPSYPTPLDWHAAYQRREQLLREVHCSYEEDVIKVYNIGRQVDLDLWSLVLPLSQLSGLGAALTALNRLDLRMPFLTAQLDANGNLLLTMCFASANSEPVKQVLGLYLSALSLQRKPRVAAFFLVGPHFGDRHGITNVLLEALGEAAVQPLAVGCAISSISLITRAEDQERTMQALTVRFELPAARPSSP